MSIAAVKPAGSSLPVMKDPSTHSDSQLAPSLQGIPFFKAGTDPRARLLSEPQRRQLARIATRLRLPARAVIYRESTPANWVFAISEGVVKGYRTLPRGKRMINAFLFPNDLFGLAENGRYLNTAQAVTPVTLHQLPLDKLIQLMKQDADLQFPFLVKITHELRESQRQMILMGRRRATCRFAMFLVLMNERLQRSAHEREIPLPMTRRDIADFLGLSREALSRAVSQLERRGIARFDNRHVARIVDPGQLAKLATPG